MVGDCGPPKLSAKRRAGQEEKGKRGGSGGVRGEAHDGRVDIEANEAVAPQGGSKTIIKHLL